MKLIITIRVLSQQFLIKRLFSIRTNCYSIKDIIDIFGILISLILNRSKPEHFFMEIWRQLVGGKRCLPFSRKSRGRDSGFRRYVYPLSAPCHSSRVLVESECRRSCPRRRATPATLVIGRPRGQGRG